MRFLVDNSLSHRFAESLRAANHEATHVRDVDLTGAEDVTIFDHAAGKDQVIIAQDTDFGTILALRQSTVPSVILFRCQLKSTERLIGLLLANLSAVEADLESGSIVVIEDSRLRVRRLPLARSRPGDEKVSP